MTGTRDSPTPRFLPSLLTLTPFPLKQMTYVCCFRGILNFWGSSWLSVGKAKQLTTLSCFGLMGWDAELQGDKKSNQQIQLINSLAISLLCRQWRGAGGRPQRCTQYLERWLMRGIESLPTNTPEEPKKIPRCETGGELQWRSSLLADELRNYRNF